jgi:iron complex transport system substrate-binding protein
LKVAIINAAALTGALAVSLALASSAVHPSELEVTSGVGAADVADDGEASSQRIASASSVADQVLAEIARPEDVVAISTAARGAPTWRFAGAARIVRVQDVEGIVELRPTVVFASAIGGDRSVQRLREAGIRVVSLGDLRGFDSLPEEIERIGEAIGAEARAAEYAQRLRRRMNELRAQETVARGIYLSVHGTHFYGGTAGSSYGDVLRAGGVEDVAAAAGFTGWPDYSAEEILRLNPPLLVMPEGHPEALCRIEAMSTLSACRTESFVTLPADVLNDPGPALVEAAAALRTLVERMSP